MFRFFAICEYFLAGRSDNHFMDVVLLIYRENLNISNDLLARQDKE